MSDSEYYILDKNSIKKRYGLSDENIDFYVQVGLIEKVKKNEYKINKKIDNMSLDRKTVFKYCFEDNWLDGLKDFEKSVKYSGKVKIYTKEEIEELNKKLKK